MKKLRPKEAKSLSEPVSGVRSRLASVMVLSFPRALGASSPDLNSTALGGVNALRRISEDGAVACCFLQQLGLSPKGLYPCPRPFSSETPFSHCTMGRPSPGCLWVRGDHYLGRLVISVTSDASAAAEAGERDMRILPGQIPQLAHWVP